MNAVPTGAGNPGYVPPNHNPYASNNACTSVVPDANEGTAGKTSSGALAHFTMDTAE